MEIKNKKVVVTGAASGIGKELCIAFKSHGAASICAVDVNLDGAQETAQQISGMSLFADVSKEEDIKNVIEKTTKEFGGIDIFCSNAGIGGLPGFFESETADWQKIWEINVQAHIHAAKHVLGIGGHVASVQVKLFNRHLRLRRHGPDYFRNLVDDDVVVAEKPPCPARGTRRSCKLWVVTMF